MKKDQTGTNPINFSKDFRVYNEFTWLNTPGDSYNNVTTLEYRTPIGSGRWQWRIRGRYSFLNADLNDDGHNEIRQNGLGDVDMRFLTVLKYNFENNTAWATGVELFLDTATADVLGTGNNTIGPQIFWGKFWKGGLFAPGLQYRFSVSEDTLRPDWAPIKIDRVKTNQIVIDLNYLSMADNKLSWFFMDPQIIIDLERDEEYAIVDFEWGWMMAKWVPDMKGHSFYVRPSIGIGADRLTDYSVELGYKIVGW